ncbi:MAG: hypothetical protein QCI82_00810 [Candidatus Thermoplasmatota archaeon]|nr:hypothetical protein [Candidatus Thermoplasmatota archaeon]
MVCKRIHSQPLDPDRFVDPSIEEEYPDRSYHTIFVGEIQRSFGRDD